MEPLETPPRFMQPRQVPTPASGASPSLGLTPYCLGAGAPAHLYEESQSALEMPLDVTGRCNFIYTYVGPSGLADSTAST